MKVKYPRTPHLPFSPGCTSDDRKLDSVSHFKGMEVVVTAKVDGENSNLYRNGYHARSLDTKNHDSRNWIKTFHASFAHEIPEGWRICGENLFAKHSIHYKHLRSYFYCFSIYNENNICLSWDETEFFCEIIGIELVPVLYRGIFDEEKIKDCFLETVEGDPQEGYVVRNAGEFYFDDFDKNVAKFVRENHVQTDEHWMTQKVVPNILKC